MKYVALLLSIIFTSTAFAVDPARSFICSAEDSLGRQSVLTFDVDDKTIFIKSADDPSTPAQVIYDTRTSCGLKVGTRETCVTQLSHNLDDQSRPYSAMRGSIRCTLSNRPIPEHNADFELNGSGDGTGAFVCGRLSKFNLALFNCSLTIE